MQILQTSKGWFTNLMMEMDSIIKAVILHQSKGTPFSKLLPKGKSVIHKVWAVNEPAPVMLCCHGTAKLEPQIQGVIFNSFPLKTLFVVSMAKMMIVMRALCTDSLPLKRGCFPLSCAVFSQMVKKKSMYNYLESKYITSVAEWIAPGIILDQNSGSQALMKWNLYSVICRLPRVLSFLSGGLSTETHRLPLLSAHCWSISLNYLNC